MASPTPVSPKLSGLYAKLDIGVELRAIGGAPEAFPARVYRVSVGLAELSSRVYFPPNQKVELRCGDRWIQSRVSYCRPERNDRFNLALRMTPEVGVRREIRTELNLETSLQIAGSLGRISARVVDLSPSGVGFETPAELSLGTRVWIALGSSNALGEVRHCTAIGDRYRAGIRLEKLTRCDDETQKSRMDLDNGIENNAILTAFERSIEEEQAKLEAMLTARDN
jgi:hypothetical protein